MFLLLTLRKYLFAGLFICTIKSTQWFLYEVKTGLKRLMNLEVTTNTDYNKKKLNANFLSSFN